MAKAILISTRPQWVEKMLNREKTIEIRKKFPKDYVGWVYIYCTKANNILVKLVSLFGNAVKYVIDLLRHKKRYSSVLNGKVVARFWCDKVKGAYNFYVEELCQLACINKEELYKYAGGWYKTDDLLAIHITKLEIFDKPKEISEFEHQVVYENIYTNEKRYLREPLRKAPQSWCYVEELL